MIPSLSSVPVGPFTSSLSPSTLFYCLFAFKAFHLFLAHIHTLFLILGLAALNFLLQNHRFSLNVRFFTGLATLALV